MSKFGYNENLLKQTHNSIFEYKNKLNFGIKLKLYIISI